MIKKYIILISAILVILMLASTSSASFLFSKGEIYERLQESSIFRNALDRVSQIISHDDSSVSIDIIGEVTPDNRDAVVVEENDLGETTTVDVNGEEGATLNDVVIVDENGEEGATNEITVDEDGENGRTIERVIDIITENNVVIGTVLQRIIERTFAPGTTESSGVTENIVDNVVVTDNDQ